MADKKTTQLHIREDRPTAISSATFGANLNAFGFNIDLIASKNPKLAVALIKNYGDAYSIQANVSSYHFPGHLVSFQRSGVSRWAHS
jgi:hypothetical protein